MPYIPKDRRGKNVITAGELNYHITQDILDYLEELKEVIPSFGNIPSSKLPNRYTDYNEVIGVLECVKQELYRRLIAPHEDKKKEEHGDVYY